MAVEVGVLLPTREAVMSGRPETAPLLAMAERAEAAGFDSVWVGDSLTARPRHEPLALLAGVAARTHRVRLGTGVLLPDSRPARASSPSPSTGPACRPPPAPRAGRPTR